MSSSNKMYCASYFSGEKSHWWCNGFNIFSRIKQDTVGVKGSKTMAALLYRQSCVWTNPLAVKLGGGELMFVLQHPADSTLSIISPVGQRTLGTNRTMIHQHWIQICNWQRKESRWCNAPVKVQTSTCCSGTPRELCINHYPQSSMKWRNIVKKTLITSSYLCYKLLNLRVFPSS